MIGFAAWGTNWMLPLAAWDSNPSPYTRCGNFHSRKLAQTRLCPKNQCLLSFGTLLRGPPGVGNFSTRMVGAERLLARLPGVRSASIEGDSDRAAEVRLLVEEDPPVSEILEAARDALDGDGAEFPLGAFFHIQVASGGDESPYLQSRIDEDPVAASPATPEDDSIRLITHQVRDVSPGVIGIELTLGLAGHRFAGGASGKADLPGRNRVPALATLSALGSYIRFASKGGGPTLALESVSEFSLDASRVAVVVVTMSGHATPLIASWPLTGAPGPAVVRATLEAAARRVTRLSTGRDRPPREAILREQAESLLESAGPIASACIVFDNVKGFRIHVLATAEISKSAVSRMVMTLLQEGLGLRVRLGPDHRGPEPPFRRGVGSRSPPYVAGYIRPCLGGGRVPARLSRTSISWPGWEVARRSAYTYQGRGRLV